MKNKKKEKETLNDGILEFLEAQPTIRQGHCYHISNNFHF